MSREVIAELKRGRDPLLNLLFRHSDASQSDPGKREKWIQDVVETGDPLLLTMGVAFSIFTENKDDASNTYFDGQWLSDKEQHALSAAVSSVHCELGWSCDENDMFVLSFCAIAGVCAPNLQTFINENTLHGDEEAIRLSQQYLAKIVKAINNRDVSIFRAPGKSK